MGTDFIIAFGKQPKEMLTAKVFHLVRPHESVFSFTSKDILFKKKSPDTMCLDVQKLESRMHLLEKEAVKSSPSTVASYLGVRTTVTELFLQDPRILMN